MQDLKDRGAKIIIGDFYEVAARKVMCQAYKSEMMQKQGYVWLLPGWFNSRWYDIDMWKRRKQESKSLKDFLMIDRETTHENINMNYDTSIENLPNCTTKEMIQALNGHFSLVHKKFAPEDSIMETSKTIAEWKNQVEEHMEKINLAYQKQGRAPSDRLTLRKLNDNGGYVYDAVWLYAKALEELVKTDETYLQNLHSNRSVEAFVEIVKKIDFNGVSGRINFYGRSSRLSDIDIIQWSEDNNGTIISPTVIGLYKPNYTTYSEDANLSNPEIFNLTDDNIVWHTSDGKKPSDEDKDCWIFSGLAVLLDIDCQNSIAITFLNGFALLLLTSGVLFLTIKRRYENFIRS